MDRYKLLSFLDKHRKKLLLANHAMLIIHLITLLLAVLDGSFEGNKPYYLWMFIFQIVMFIIISIQFMEDGS